MGSIIFIVFSFLVLALVVAASVQRQRDEAKRREALKTKLTTLYAPDELYFAPDYKSAFGVSRQRQSLILFSADYYGEYSFSKVAAVEVLRDQVSVTNTNRGSQAAGAVIGELAFGGLGALAGALSGSSRTRSYTSQIDLKVIVDCDVKPVYVVNFFKSAIKKGVSPTHPSLKARVELVDRCHAIAVNGMRKSVVLPTTSKPPATDLAISTDQIRLLWDLKQSGALTEDEFALAKRRLLESS